MREDFVHDDRVVAVVLGLVGPGELLYFFGDGRGRSENVIGLELGLEAIADFFAVGPK